MADGCSLVSSAHTVSNRVIIFSSADILKHKECVDLSYDNKRLKWLGSFDSLQKFVKFGIKLHGHWSSPGGYSKKISCSSPVISITWYPGKQNSLILHGEASVALSDALTEAARVIASQNNSPSKSSLLDVSKNSDGVSMSHCPSSSSDKSSSQRFYCDCQCSLLAADLEGIKLEIAVMQSDINANASKSRSDEVNRLKIELSSERESCKRLEADLSLIIEGRSREVDEMRNIIASLEHKLKTTEAANVSLRDLINTNIPNSKPNESSPGNASIVNDNQCVPRRAERINYDPNCDLTAKPSHVGHHTIVDSKAKDLSNSVDHKFPPQAHNIIIDSNAKNLPNIIDHKSPHQAHHMIVDSNAKKLPNIIDLKSPLQAPRNSVITNVVDTYPIIDRHDFSPKSVGPSTVKSFKDIQFLPLINANKSPKFCRQSAKRPFQENAERKPPPLAVRSHFRTPEWLNHLTLVRQLSKT